MTRLLVGPVLLSAALAWAGSSEPRRFVAQRGAADAGVQDSYIWEESSDYNGNSSVLYVGMVGSSDKVSFLRFDLSELPSWVEVLEGRLVLEASGAGGVPIGVHVVTAPWEETTPTWATFSTSMKATPAATFTPIAGRNVVVLTELVRAWVGGAANHGVALRQAPLTAASAFHASEHATVSWRPQLEVLYREPPPLVSLALPAAPLEAACATEFVYPLRAHAPGATRFTAAELPAGLSLDEATGELRWRPARGDVGLKPLSLSVTDGQRTEALSVALLVRCGREYDVGCSASPALLGLGLLPWLLGLRRRGSRRRLGPWPLALAAGLTLGCSREGPVARGGPRPLTLRCEVDVPSGWLVSPSPMPDHLLEARFDGPQGPAEGMLIIRERPERSLASAATEVRDRTTAAYAQHPGFKLTLDRVGEHDAELRFWWGDVAQDAPDARWRWHLLRLSTHHGVVVLQSADARDEGALEALLPGLSAMRCVKAKP